MLGLSSSLVFMRSLPYAIPIHLKNRLGVIPATFGLLYQLFLRSIVFDNICTVISYREVYECT